MSQSADGARGLGFTFARGGPPLSLQTLFLAVNLLDRFFPQEGVSVVIITKSVGTDKTCRCGGVVCRVVKNVVVHNRHRPHKSGLNCWQNFRRRDVTESIVRHHHTRLIIGPPPFGPLRRSRRSLLRPGLGVVWLQLFVTTSGGVSAATGASQMIAAFAGCGGSFSIRRSTSCPLNSA